MLLTPKNKLTTHISGRKLENFTNGERPLVGIFRFDAADDVVLIDIDRHHVTISTAHYTLEYKHTWECDSANDARLWADNNIKSDTTLHTLLMWKFKTI